MIKTINQGNNFISNSITMADIEITQLGRPFHTRYNPDTTLNNLNINLSQKIRNNMLGEMSSNETQERKIVPIKEYSNKFLRESASKENQKKNTKNTRLTTIVNKHKNFQKKYQKMLGKKMYVCKTEPNQNEYQCFTTGKNFYRAEGEVLRVKTQNMIEKSPNEESIELEDKCEIPENIEQAHLHALDRDNANASKCEGFVCSKKDDKISTSRALELFSRIVSKDRGDLLDKLRVCNQKKVFKQKLMESSKNLEAHQIVLAEKTRKLSFLEKGQRKYSMKSSLKSKQRKKSVAHRIYREDQNFEIKGWDVPY